jgi:hypothetical protein
MILIDIFWYFFLLYLNSVGSTLSPITVFLKRFYSRMSSSKDCQDRKFETNPSPDPSSKLNRNDRKATEKLTPPNAFLLYRSEKQVILRSRMKDPLPHDISRIVALWWHQATPETKEYYRSLSSHYTERHDARFSLILKNEKLLNKQTHLTTVLYTSFFSQVVSTGKLSRMQRVPKVPKEQLRRMGHLRVTLPRYLQFVREANDAIRPKEEHRSFPSVMAFQPIPYRPYEPLIFPYRIQHIVCHCHTCELPISSIAKPIGDDDDYDDVDRGDSDHIYSGSNGNSGSDET